MFATISNFSDFYEEVNTNNHGLECLRLLNEIICDFDFILDDERFKAVDKIKTIGTTYMAAIGLYPDYTLPAGPISCDPPPPTTTTNALSANETGKEINQISKTCAAAAEKALNNRRQVARYLQTLVMFLIEMKVRLNDINTNSFNKFMLQAGINLGPVTAGVIGASKPQYDIWGNTVNVASRMESTAEPNRIQITEEVYEILRDFNQEQKFTFSCRGKINVKGKGTMTTYYLNYK